jgi:hypothetical protein
VSRAKTYRTTAAHFAIFKREVERCVKRWGITEWRLHVLHEGERHPEASFASGEESRGAAIRMSRTWQNKPTAAEIKWTARHEATHFLLAPLYDAATSRYISQAKMVEANESVCERVEKLLP